MVKIFLIEGFNAGIEATSEEEAREKLVAAAVGRKHKDVAIEMRGQTARRKIAEDLSGHSLGGSASER